MQKTEAFITDDGKVFMTQEEAQMYEARIKAEASVEDYQAQLYASGLSLRAASRRAKAVADYLMWQMTGEVPVVVQDGSESEEAA